MRAALSIVLVCAVAAPAAAEVPVDTCSDGTRVLGHRTCGSFGDDTLVTRFPAISVGLLTQARRVRAAPDTMASTLIPRTTETEPGRSNTIGSGLRIMLGIRPWLAVGTDLAMGFGVDNAASFAGAWGLLALQRQVAHYTIAAEGATGFMYEDLGAGLRRSSELRLRVARWVTPWVSAGTYVGREVLGGTDLQVGVSFAFHVRAYDAAR